MKRRIATVSNRSSVLGGGYFLTKIIILFFFFFLIPVGDLFSASQAAINEVAVSAVDVTLQQRNDTIHVDTLHLRFKASSLLPELFLQPNATDNVLSEDPTGQMDDDENNNNVLNLVGWLVIDISGLVIIYCAILLGYSEYKKQYKQRDKYLRGVYMGLIVIMLVATVFLLTGQHRKDFAMAIIAGIMASLMYSIIARVVLPKDVDHESKNK